MSPRSLTSLALRASEAVDTGASVGPDASAAVLTAVLTHGWRGEEEEDIKRQSWERINGTFISLLYTHYDVSHVV